MRNEKRTPYILTFLFIMFCLVVPSQVLADEHETVQWINHLEFIPEGSDVATSYTPINGGLKVTATETGQSFIVQGVPVTPGFLVSGVRVCYELTDAESFIDQLVITQLEDPPVSRMVVLNDTTALSDMGPICVNSAPPFDEVDPSQGALNLSLGMGFADINDSITVLGVGLLTVPDPNSPISQLEDDVEKLNSNIERIAAVLIEHGMRLDTLEEDLDRLTDAVIKHTHIYRTGKGVGHNNVEAASSTFTFETETAAPKAETPAPKAETPAPKAETPAPKKIKKQKRNNQ